MFHFARKDERAIIPTRNTKTDAGIDLYTYIDETVPSHSQKIIDTGIAVSMPCDCYARVAPRSGLAAKYSIDVLAGVVDCEYTDSIKVILYNHSDKDVHFVKGDRIAQLIFERIYIPAQINIIDYSMIKPTNRGTRGFGSSG
jgi:dUTP pyrophosphatase